PLLADNTLFTLLAGRFVTGFFLAGIYPVGMKIAADHFDRGLGKSLGFLVGALVLGTAFPHLLRSIGEELPWRGVFLLTSTAAVIGGTAIGWFVPDGPYRKQGKFPRFGAFFTVFQRPGFRKAAFGYFGHMWELYTFWTFVPLLLTLFANEQANVPMNISSLSFGIIAIGGLACVLGGYLSEQFGVRQVARGALMISGSCCLLLPLLFYYAPTPLFITYLFLWGMVVVMDSPLFSTLVAQNADATIKGTALTIVNCIGFGLTIVSIQLLTGLMETIGLVYVFPLLAIGPVFGVLAISRQGTSEDA
ncbi:MAG: MFS transporter, partial [Bacteroidota bacterium]